MWMPVTDTSKPNESLGNHVLQSTSIAAPIPSTVVSSTTVMNKDGYKEKYGSMKVKLKDILYENELFQDELKTLKRELLDIYRDKEALLQKVLQFEGSSFDSSDESELDNTNNNVIRKQAAATSVSVSDNDDRCDGQKARVGPKNDGDSNNNKKICINLKPTPPKAAITKTTSNPRPKTTANRSRKTTSTVANVAAKSNCTTNANTKDIVNVATKAPSKKAPNNKAVNGAEGPKPAAVKKERKKPQPKPKQPSVKQQQAQQKQQQVQQPHPQQQQQQQQLPQQQLPQPQQLQQPVTSPQPITYIQQMNQPAQQLHLVQQQQTQQASQSQPFKVEPQQIQQQQYQHPQPITVLGQMALSNDQIKYVQHVNLPVQNLENGGMIVSNNRNPIQVQQQQRQSHIINQQGHQIHFQLPQTTLAPVMDAFQTPQSIITTQGNQINFGGQSYTIVSSSTNGTAEMIQHDQNQIQQHQLNNDSTSPTEHQQMVTQIVPMNSIIQQDMNSISPQSIQEHSPDNQQHQQQYHHQQQQQSHLQQSQQLQHLEQQQQPHQPNNNSQYQHPVVQYQSSPMIPVQMNQQQSHQPQEEQVGGDVVDFEHLDSRRMEQTALMLPYWETSDIFEADNIKFMVED